MDKNQIQDEQLIILTAKGDKEAFDVLIKRHQHMVHGLAARLVSSHTIAEDITQDAFLRVYQSSSRFTPQAKFTTWLYKIVYNLCMDHLRKPKHLALSDEGFDNLPDNTDFGGELEKREMSEKIHLAIDQLPERQKQALIMHRFGGLSHSQIAQITGATNGAVESLLVRAYSELRVKLKSFKDMV